MLVKLLEDWEKELARPVVVNVATAGLLFIAALALKDPILSWLGFDPVAQYPLICAAEPYKQTGEVILRTDVFIINRELKDFSNEELAERLRVFQSESASPFSPNVDIRMKPNVRLIGAEADQAFNEGKGELDVTTTEATGLVQIRVLRIEERAILKVTIRTAARSLDVPIHIPRGAKGQTPFDHLGLQQKCYSET